MKTTTFNNTIIHYNIFGNGNPLVFLHGFLEDSTMWTDFTEPLTKTNQVILIDLPCHGQTRFDGDECSMAFMAECVKTVLNNEKITNPKVFGHSMGGYVGLELLKLVPIQLTLVHSNFWADDEDKQNDRARVMRVVNLKKEFFIKEAIPNLFFEGNRKKCDVAIQTLIQQANKIPAKEICAAIMGLKNRSKNHELMDKHHINFIQGELDVVMTVQQLEKELKHLTTPQNISTIYDCGHMSIWEKTNELHKLVNDFVID